MGQLQQLEDVLAVLLLPPSALQCPDAVHLALTSQRSWQTVSKASGFWRWHCQLRIDCIADSPELAPLWMKLATLMEGVQQASYSGTHAMCRWVLESPSDIHCAIEALKLGSFPLLSLFVYCFCCTFP